MRFYWTKGGRQITGLWLIGGTSHGSLTLQLFDIPKTHKLVLVLIPEAQEEGVQASAEGKPAHMQFPRFSVALGEVVVGDAGTHVMDVMESDVPGGPLKNGRELVVRSAPQGGRQVVPLFLAGIIGARKIMLDIKDPNAKGPPDKGDRHLNKEVFPDAYGVPCRHDNSGDCNVCEVYAELPF